MCVAISTDKSCCLQLKGGRPESSVRKMAPGMVGTRLLVVKKLIHFGIRVSDGLNFDGHFGHFEEKLNGVVGQLSRVLKKK